VTSGTPRPPQAGAPANSDARLSDQEKKVTMTTAWQFAISLAIGVLVGIGYGLLKVRSPAPPPIALVGLLGMLLGQQLISWLLW
jgi:XapX domain-containing protein